jgi:hypothetical protein
MPEAEEDLIGQKRRFTRSSAALAAPEKVRINAKKRDTKK